MKGYNTYFVAAVFALGAVGCQHLPEDRAHRGAAVGGAAGAVTGAIIADNSVMGAILGGLLGAGGGYVIGAETRRVEEQNRIEAERAAQRAQTQPVTAEEARQASTADINGDGFVTMDEVIAMNDAGFSDQEMIRRLEATNQVFELTSEQEGYLINQGVSRTVVSGMAGMNRHLIEDAESPRDDVISQPAT